MLSPGTLRQIFILIGMNLSSLMEAYIFGHTVSMVASLYAEKKELDVSDDTISWILAVVFIPIILGGVTTTVITERFGRRVTIFIFNLLLIIYWIILYHAKAGYIFILARLLAGFGIGGLMPAIFVGTGEYSSPQRRGTFFAIIQTMNHFGGVTGSLVSLAYHWRTTALIPIIPSIFAAVMPLFYVESPQWLASRGRFRECEEAFRALHGYNSEKELQLLLDVEKCKFDKSAKKPFILVELMKKLKTAGGKRYFWNLMALACVIQIYKVICGFMLNVLLGVTTLQHFTGTTDVLRYSVLVSGFTLLGCLVSNVILSTIKTRILILSGGIINNILLIILSVVLYINLGNDSIFCWIKTSLLGFHIFVLVGSVYPLLEMIPQEMYPLEIKTTCTTLMGVFSSMLFFVYSKTIPDLIVNIDYYGVYIISVLLMSCCLLFFWFKLPETRGRTLQEIELYLKNGKFIKIEDVLRDDQIKSLV